MKKIQKDRMILSVRVGPKGQITLPAEVRTMFDVREGETLMIMADIKRGIAVLKADMFYQMMGGVFGDGDPDNRSAENV